MQMQFILEFVQMCLMRGASFLVCRLIIHRLPFVFGLETPIYNPVRVFICSNNQPECTLCKWGESERRKLNAIYTLPAWFRKLGIPKTHVSTLSYITNKEFF